MKFFHKVIWLSVLAVILASLIIVSSCTDHYVVFGDGKKVDVELAITPEEKQVGLMFRETLCADCGMLFVFDDEMIRSFWMKNTLIPLDIIFISENLSVGNVLSAEPCEQDPCRLYKGLAKFVLEVNKGFAEKNGIMPGQKVKLVGIE